MDEPEWDGTKLPQHSDEADRSAPFSCRPKKRLITIRKCLEDFTDAHAKKKKNKCWCCEHGAKTRIEYAFGIEATEQRVRAMLAISSTQSIQPWMWRALKVVTH